MTEGSVWIARFRRRIGVWPRHGAPWIAAAAVLIVAAVVFAYLGARSAMGGARQLEVVSELQVLVRDLSASSLLAMSGDAVALGRLRDRSASIDAALDVLVHGGDYKGERVPPAPAPVQTQLDEVAAQWADFRRRTEAILLLDRNAAAPAPKYRSTSRAPDGRPPGKPSSARPAAHGAAAAAALRTDAPDESGWAGISVLKDGHAFAAAADGLRGSMDAMRTEYSWTLLAAFACAAGACAAIVAFGAALRRARQVPQRAAALTDATMLEVLRPAIRTFNVYSKGTDQPDPLVLAKRLSDAILEFVDGMRRVVSALTAATSKANSSAAAGHRAARILAVALHQETQASVNLRASARRIAAAHGALATRAVDVQQQSVRTLEITGIGLEAARDSVRLADQMRNQIQDLPGTYKNVAATNSEVIRSLKKLSDLSTHAEGLALRVGAQSTPHGEGGLTAFAGEIQGCLASSVAEIRGLMTLTQDLQRKSNTFKEQLERAASSAIDQSCNADDALRALASTENALRQFADTVAVATRLATGVDASPLLAAIDEIARQVTDSSASGEQVLDATKEAAERVEELAKLLSDLRKA